MVGRLSGSTAAHDDVDVCGSNRQSSVSSTSHVLQHRRSLSTSDVDDMPPPAQYLAQEGADTDNRTPIRAEKRQESRVGVSTGEMC